METNNHQIVDYDIILDAKFGKEGTPERIQAEEDAYAFYTGQILHDARNGSENHTIGTGQTHQQHQIVHLTH